MSDEPFLSRWSRRKRAAKAEEPAIPPPPPTAAEAEAQAPQSPPPPELPPVESLGKDSDYSAFLRDGVPQELKQAALQKLWASDPGLMAPEIMDLHVGDYTAPTLEAITTAWRLGRGVLDAAERAAEAQDEELKAAPESPPADSKS